MTTPLGEVLQPLAGHPVTGGMAGVGLAALILWALRPQWSITINLSNRKRRKRRKRR